MTQRKKNRRVAGRKLATALCDYLEVLDGEYPKIARTAEVLNDLLCDIQRDNGLSLSTELSGRVHARRLALLDVVRSK